ncbi:hypothetical protein KSP9073_00811 [Kushneria phyllosphaerae]|uniref:Uncharacterized protein n=1 Tax=Kushneria phyllosphaerae TaxID=2100822 RepID=A0A2R8CIU3_9GAMM|nr:hypothetical protein KSP9073_00811 [Kushneria phyllosphaerae]
MPSGVPAQVAVSYSDVKSNIVLFGRIIYAILCID